MYPEVYAELNLIFDNDYDVNEITVLTAIIPDGAQKRNENRISPLTQKPIEGYWTIKSAAYSCFNINVALYDIIAKIKDKLQEIIEICNNHHGEADFCVVITFQSDNKPAIYFERDFLDIVQKLHATIQMDLYVV